MDLDKWNDFISVWSEALKAYNTPLTFIKGARVTKGEMELDRQLFPYVSENSPNFEMRGELMAKQEPYIAKQPMESYCLYLDSDCLLCQNVIHGIDSINFPDEILNNIMSDYGEFIMVPNRYPARLGHSLFMPKNHDDMKLRVLPETDSNGNKRYPKTPRKTRGGIITKRYFSALAEACDNHNLVAARNHALDGMSILWHEHFQLYPKDLSQASLIDYVLDGEKKEIFKEGIYRLTNTPFDILCVDRTKSNSFVEDSCSILEKMEKDNQVFTLVYWNGYLLISPRQNTEDDRPLKIGSGSAIHFFKDYDALKDEIKAFIPKKGEYGWEKYIH